VLLLPALPAGLLLYALKIWDRRRLKEFSQTLFIGKRTSASAMARHLESHADLVVSNNVYSELRALVAQEKEEGYRHVIATASYRLYTEAIARRLGFDDVIATDLVTDNYGRILVKIDGDNCYDAAKLRKVTEWMAAQGLVRDKCHIRAYSDHISDAPLLEFANQPFATNPHEPLRQLAEKRGWAILDWR
jgi:HAD superfamily hydrolase (TIGR01490 family)